MNCLINLNSIRPGYTDTRPTIGSALIGLVAAILIFSVLAAAIVPMISSSGQQVAAGDMAAKAYLLAESGFRYAASGFLRAGASEHEKNVKLNNLEGDYTLNSNNEKFKLDIFSYFYELTVMIVSGDTVFFAKAPGTFPGVGTLPDEPDDEIELDKTQGLKILIGNDVSSQIYELSVDVNWVGNSLRFTTTTPLSPFPANVNVYPVADAATDLTPTISHGGDLSYEEHMGEIFPLRNGCIRVGNRILTYRFNDKQQNQFKDVRDPQDSSMSDHPVAPEIILTRYVRLHATGIYGADPSATQRTLVYYTPLPISESATRREVFTDRFDSSTADDWKELSPGSHTIVDNALQVEDTVNEGTDQGSLIQFNPTSDEAKKIDFNASRRGSSGFLSYDTQIKVGYNTVPAPDNVVAGLSFRLNNTDALDGNVNDIFSNNSFGLSYVRGNESDDAGIPNDIIPVNDQRAIVLWEQTDDGARRTWLAYKEMMVDLHYMEDFETGNGGWTRSPDDGSNLWNTSGRIAHSGSGAWYYGHEPSPEVYNYHAGHTSGTIESPEIIIPSDASNIKVSFRSWHQTEPGRQDDPTVYDLKQVIISSHLPDIIYTIADNVDEPGAWNLVELDLSSVVGLADHAIRIRFRFDTLDDLNNNYEGWYIDDVRVFSDEPSSIQDATLAVRLKEALVVRFKEGTSEIRKGDRIFGAIQGTIGTVIEKPIVNNEGTWTTEKPSSGTFLLNRTSVIRDPAFLENEELFAMGGLGQAQVEKYSEDTDRKANIIKVYYASENGHGDENGNNNPFDRITKPYPRLASEQDSLEWPSELDENGNWTPEMDFFRFIRWDKINPDIETGLSKLSFMTTDHDLVENAIIQRYHEDLQTPEFPGIFNAAEIGLHTFGQGSTQVYFDDFGIQIEVAQDSFLPLPLQR